MKNEIKKDILSDMELLKGIIEEAFLVKLLSRDRKRDNVDARMIFAKILRERGYTYKSIGNYLYKDHSTIIHYTQQASNLIRTDKKTMELYIQCRNTFLENTDPIILHTDRDLVKEILSLRNQMDDLVWQYQEAKSTEKKYKRLESIINLIDVRTPTGSENVIKKKINEMFNGL